MRSNIHKGNLKMPDLISIVVPCYNEEETINIFYGELKKDLSSIENTDHEIIFVDDGSKDNTIHLIRQLAADDDHVRYISFSRNFGKESAMYAGLTATKGDYVAVMDADMQDPPALIAEMYDLIRDPEKEYDCIGTRRKTRKGEPPIRSFFARLFYKIINGISDTEIVDGARDFRLMSRRFVNSVLSLAEKNRFSKGLFSWVGYNTKWLEYENIERVAGTTKWSFWKLFKYSIEGIVDFSSFPLFISYIVGILSELAFLVFLLMIIIKAISGAAISSAIVIATLVLFFAGIQLLTIGIMGEYISRIYSEVRNRPIYLSKESSTERKN